MPASLEYLALRQKVDAFAAQVQTQRLKDMQCRAGCAGCCAPGLSVCGVEAAAIRDHLATLPAAARDALSERAARWSRERAGAERCVMLDEEDRCQIYAARPLVCRTQGLPLRYPAELIPVDAVRVRAGQAAVTWCPLNFPAEPPTAAQTLDAERVDELLAIINQRHAAASDTAPLARTPLAALAGSAGSLEPPAK